jgi:hypothetical protein
MLTWCHCLLLCGYIVSAYEFPSNQFVTIGIGIINSLQISFSYSNSWPVICALKSHVHDTFATNSPSVWLYFIRNTLYWHSYQFLTTYTLLSIPSLIYIPVAISMQHTLHSASQDLSTASCHNFFIYFSWRFINEAWKFVTNDILCIDVAWVLTTDVEAVNHCHRFVPYRGSSRSPWTSPLQTSLSFSLSLSLDLPV